MWFSGFLSSRKARCRFAAGLAAFGAAQGAFAANYEFLACPAVDLNRVYRLDRATGEVGACQYGLGREGSVGVTLCYPPGEGAGPQASSEYSLIASRHTGESGVFRVDLRTGTMAICYVLNDSVVCTAPAR
ncbi:hypothetical protein [Methylocapsa aurea]|uniref:hypothetical protein n=1 Tax=Methylocapsa aurea TaxID=663610 RepID=UPI0006911572|nr:hypothetical protein [Methylocapsa aurea]